MFFAALLVQTNPAAAPLDEIIPDLHFQHGVDAGEGVDHDADQGAIAQADQGASVDRVQQRPSLIGIEDRRPCPF